MTIACDAGDGAAIDLAEFVEALAAGGFDPDCEGAFAEAGPLLGALGRNRHFLGDLMLDELRGRARAQERDNDYGPPVLLLHRGPGWFVRANIWPDARDPLLRASGPRSFFYDVPHDHNFTFLTCGYFGPGYWSDHYEADPATLAGAPGMPAGLRFIARRRLAEGEVRLYRAHVDVHTQHPPDRGSVSLNLLQGTAGRAFLDQYRYDVAGDSIAGQLAASSSEALLALLPALGGEEGADLLDRFACNHPCDRIRFGAIAARAAALGGDAGQERLVRAARDGNRTVAALARVRIAAQAGRASRRDGAVAPV